MTIYPKGRRVRVKHAGALDCCGHDWVTNTTAKVLSTNPPVIIEERICAICGQLEEIEISSITFENTFKQLYDKFYGGKQDARD